MMQFCKEFNSRTEHVRPDVPIRVILTAFEDRSWVYLFIIECLNYRYRFVTKPPPTTWFLKKASGLEKGEGNPGHSIAGKIGIKYIYEIAKVKQETDKDLFYIDLESIVKMIIGSCKSMGLVVVEDTLPPPKINVEL